MNPAKNKLLRLIGTIEKKEWISVTKNYKITLVKKNIFFFTRRGEQMQEKLADLVPEQRYFF